MTNSVEREIKLAVPADFRLPEPSRLAPGLTVAPAVSGSQTSVYFDTDGLRLARWGCGLRHRTNDGWTVKLGDEGAGAAVERREFVLGGGRGEPGAPPAAARDLVQAFTRGAALRPVAVLRCERERVEIQGPDATLLAEVTDDRVAVLEGRARGLRFREVELEFGEDCSRRQVEAILERLRAAGAGPSHRVAKHARALGLEGGVAPELRFPTVDADSSVGDVLCRALAGPVDRMVRSDPGVRSGEDPEDLHHMRVATRRLRSHLRTFGALLDPDFAERLRSELRELATLLGAVRDADVLRARLAGLAGSPEAPEARAIKQLLERLDEGRDGDRARLLAWLRSERHNALIERAIAAVNAPRLRCDAGAPAAPLLAKPVRRRWRRLERAVSRIGQPPEDRALHRARIAAKHTRYAAEVVAPVLGRRLGGLARALRPVQDALGEHQDAVVAGAWLAAAGPRLDGEAAFGAGRLSVLEEQRARRALADWWVAWRRARRRGRRCVEALRSGA